MQKSYLLLRNNQQSGPYRLEELTSMALRAKDLVWVIGQSAGWRYPEEIEVLKSCLSGATPQTPAEIVESKEVVSPQQRTNKSTPEESVENTSRHIYVSLPTKPEKDTAEQVTDAPTLSFEQRVEKMRQRVAHVETEIKAPQEPEVETKYTRSLDDIKAEYSSWIHRKTRKRKIEVKQIAVVAALCLGIVIGTWTIYHFIANSSSSEPAAKDERLVEFHPTPVQPAPIVKAKKSSQSNKKSNRAGRQSGNNNNLLVKTSQNEKTNSQALPQQAIDKDIATTKSDDSPESITEKQAATKSEKAAAVVDQLQLQADYISNTKSRQGVGGLEIAIKNNSSQMMKVVAVDVIYYGEGMEEIDRKTLYFSDLQPGQTLTRKAPAHKTAEGAYAQLGLISSEAGNIFYASNR